jgi:hypothetical protein
VVKPATTTKAGPATTIQTMPKRHHGWEAEDEFLGSFMGDFL